MSRLYANIAVA